MTVGPDLAFVEEVRRIADDVVRCTADDVDRRARFPAEAVEALREIEAMSALLPTDHGGGGISLDAVARACFELGRRCGSTGMVFAMHQIQVACIVRHVAGSRWFAEYLRDVVDGQRLIASATSEVGTGGNLGTSVAALEPAGGGVCTFEKQATTLSYGEFADDLLVTLRRSPEAEPGDQVLVLARADQVDLEKTTGWDPLGMRGTCSPGFRIRAELSGEQAMPVPFSTIAAQTMVPVSHILWSHVWLGIATDAFDRARAFVKGAARKSPVESVPAAPRLSSLLSQLGLLRAEIESGLRAFVEASDDDGRDYLATAAATLRFNSLKLAASEQVPLVCQGALGICGIAGYLNDSPFSVGRHLRDTLSAPLMVANDRIRATNAGLILIAKDV